MIRYRTTRRRFTDAERQRIIAVIPAHNRSVTVLWDHDAADRPLETCTIRAHVSEFSAVQKAVRAAGTAPYVLPKTEGKLT